MARSIFLVGVRRVAAVPLMALSALLVAPAPVTQPAGAADCTPVPDAGLAFGAPPLRDDNGACYSLPSVPGDVLLLRSDARVEVLDANGAQQCVSSGSGLVRCDLAGVAPYRTTSTWMPIWINRLNSPLGCSTFSAAPYGGSAVDPLELTVDYDTPGCAVGSLDAGPYRIIGTRSLPWAWYDPAGDLLCEASPEGTCGLGSAEDVTVLFSWGRGELIRAAVVPLTGDQGCLDVSTSWAAAPVTVGSSQVQMDCLAVAAEQGQRILPAVEDTYEILSDSELVDAAGAPVCPEEPDLLGCELVGPPPYRLLTWGPTTPYRAAVRDVTGMTGCPSVTPQPFGTTASDVHLDVGCRRLDAATAGSHVVKTSLGWHGGVYRSDGTLVCQDRQITCDLEGSASYLLVVDPLAVNFRTLFHRLAGAGCGVTLQAGVGGQWDGTISPRQVDCVRLSYPSGANLSLLQPADYRTPQVDIVDAAGVIQCQLGPIPGPCDLDGEAPFRALTWDDFALRYHIVLPRLDRPVGCEPLVAGPWGTARGSVLTVPRGRVAACVTAPASAFRGWNLVGWKRLRGTGAARVFAQDPTGACPVKGDEAGGIETCTLGPPYPETVSVLLSTDRSGGRWKIVQRNPRRGAGCVPAEGRRPRSPATTGRLADPLQFDCVELSASADEEFVTHFDGRDHRATMSVYPLRGLDRVCITRYTEDCRFSGFDGYRLVSHREFYARRAVPYRVEPVRIRKGGAWDARCVGFASYDEGFGPHRGRLSNSHAVECLRVQDVDGVTFYHVSLKVTDGSGRRVIPFAVSSDARSPASCDWLYDSDYSCSGFTLPVVDDGDTGLILLSRFRSSEPVPYRLRATR